MKVELGGGLYPRGDGFLNVDLEPTADIVHDLNEAPWPIDDNAVAELYTAHCIEHTADVHVFINEVCRICEVGANVEIRCPDAMSESAMCGGHRFTFTQTDIRHFDDFPERWWRGEKRLHLQGLERMPDPVYFPLARSSLHCRHLSDEEIMLWVPRTCHEIGFRFTVDRISRPA